MGTIEDIVDAILYLERTSFVTGEILHVEVEKDVNNLGPSRRRTLILPVLAVHGLSPEFLADKPLQTDEFLAFVGDAQLVARNAGFDIAFLNAELKGAGKPPIA
jgi:DNA polymerase-3 subunit epsilon